MNVFIISFHVRTFWAFNSTIRRSNWNLNSKLISANGIYSIAVNSLKGKQPSHGKLPVFCSIWIDSFSCTNPQKIELNFQKQVFWTKANEKSDHRSYGWNARILGKKVKSPYTDRLCQLVCNRDDYLFNSWMNFLSTY